MIGEKNSLIQGEHIRRKNGCIVNTGAKLSREEIRRKIAENKEQYDLPEEEWIGIELPLPEDPQLCNEHLLHATVDPESNWRSMVQ